MALESGLTESLKPVVHNKSLILLLGSIILFGLFRYLTIVYRLYLHPLSRFAGPRSAAISTSWLYNVCVNEKMPEMVFEDLHNKFGVSALRIAPNELHITDVSLYKTIYSQTTLYMKEKGFYDGFLTPHTVFAELDPHLHKERRKLLNPLFSRAGIFKLEPVFKENILALCKKIKTLPSSTPINVYDAYRCLTIDIIMRFAFGNESDTINESPTDFKSIYTKAFEAGAEGLPVLQNSPLTRFIANRIPLSIMAMLDKNVRVIFGLQETAYNGIRSYKARIAHLSYPVIFDSLDSISEKAQAAESIDILLAGSDTSAFTLSMGSFNILSNTDCKNKLMGILKERIPDRNTMPSLVELEKIDYLWAVVKESLRLAMPAAGRLPRVVPKNAPPMIVDGKVIPPGTVVGMSTYTMHTSTRIWGQDARIFRPERWLAPDGTRDGKGLEEYLSTFSKGVRQCIGINVAYAEVTMAMAYIFRNFDMELNTKNPEPSDRFTLTLPKGMNIYFRTLAY